MNDFAARLANLRLEIEAAGLNGFVVPMADAYQSEYVPPSDQRVQFLSGFTGSAGFIAVLKDKAAFFTDSRYTLQAGQQIDAGLFTVFDSAKKTPLAWLEENMRPASEIGYDPWLHSAEGVERLKKAAEKAGARAVAVTTNPIDAIWADRPAPPAEPVVPHELAYAGKSSALKRQNIAEELKKKNIAAVVITDAASVAWLLNVRGNDVANTPLPLSRVILRDDATALWFVDPRKLTEALPDHLGEGVACLAPDKFPAALEELARAGKPVLLDPSHAANWIVEHIIAAGGKIEKGDDPCELPKACKNAAELEGMRACHRRDGAALVKFFAWLDQEWRGGVNEMQAEAKLAGFRAGNNNYRGPSFDTIAGAGEHGAIVHYRATRASDAPLKDGQLFLLDSGGQYLDGTTDVTRTIALGTPTPEMRDRFTRVLKGHIALAAIRFPAGTAGSELDVLARQYLWEVGLDYGHGTGHGVGCYLGVHEGPQNISKRSKVPLQPGMVVSNEPGFYKAGGYGIRIENLQCVVEVAGGGEHKMLGFETLTLCPIDRKLIDVAMLTKSEIDWLNAYHARILQVLRPMIDESSVVWLEAATLPISR
ncbi:MAG: aminopeptidase P family protein [Alphaproteobacteria bacterium]|nr:aminopeptidase P family protein [Alphaproteobacteria bacterium]